MRSKIEDMESRIGELAARINARRQSHGETERLLREVRRIRTAQLSLQNAIKAQEAVDKWLWEKQTGFGVYAK